MKTQLALAVLALNLAAHAAPSSTTIPAQGGEIRITPIFHASFQIEFRGKVVHVDPFSMGDYSRAKKADVVLITDIHEDHLDEAALAKVIKDRTTVVAPEAVVEKLNAEKGHTLRLDHGKQLAPRGIVVQAVPMYNLVRGPQKGEFYHDKGRGNGYILNLGGKRIYIAGDTEVTPEMKALKNIDVALLPMNLPYTMTPQEAAAGAKAFAPKIVIPYHYRYPFDKANNNPQQFQAALKGSKTQVRILEWYPVAAGKTAAGKP